MSSQMSGFWVLLLLGRWSMILGWIDLAKRHLAGRNEFVSADARNLASNPRAYEMLNSVTSPQPSIKSPEPVAMSPGSLLTSRVSPSVEGKTDYFGRYGNYTSPVMSFSSPRPPSASGPLGRDRTATFSSMGYPKEIKE